MQRRRCHRAEKALFFGVKPLELKLALPIVDALLCAIPCRVVREPLKVCHLLHFEALLLHPLLEAQPVQSLPIRLGEPRTVTGETLLKV